MKNGLIKKYWNNGQFIECIYSNDKLNGPFKVYNASGRLYKKCFYINHKLNGTFKVYNTSGQLHLEYCYINDIQIGLSYINTQNNF